MPWLSPRALWKILCKGISCIRTLTFGALRALPPGNPVSVHHSCPKRETRCQFIILARKDEPTPDYARHRITRKGELTPDYAQLTPDYARHRITPN